MHSSPAVALAIVAAAACLPIVSSSMVSRDVSPTLLADMNLFSKYAAAAYCDAVDTGPVGTPITCASGNCALVEATGATLLGSFYDESLTFVSGFLALDPTNKLLVLSFRGAEGLGFLTSLGQVLVPCPTVCAACNCHAGFYGAWEEARAIVSLLLAQYIPLYPDHAVVTTGHSLGAAQAAYAAAELRNNGTAATFYNFGQPRLGDLAFSTYVTAQADATSPKSQNYRITHTDDPAPRMGLLLQGFAHIAPEYWIARDANTSTYAVGAGQIQVIGGYANLSGNGGTGGYDVPAHTEYFQANIGACAPVL